MKPMHIALGLGIVICALYILWKFGIGSKTPSVQEGFEEEDVPPPVTNENCSFLIKQKKGYEEALAAAEKQGTNPGTYSALLNALNATIKEVGCNGTEELVVETPVLTPAAAQAIAAVKASV